MRCVGILAGYSGIRRRRHPVRSSCCWVFAGRTIRLVRELIVSERARTNTHNRSHSALHCAVEDSCNSVQQYYTHTLKPIPWTNEIIQVSGEWWSGLLGGRKGVHKAHNAKVPQHTTNMELTVAVRPYVTASRAGY